jgi:NCS1 family nucleobase:cation symporter-1
LSKTVEVGPVPAEERTLGALDLFLIWAGANIVATTLAVGSSLEPSLRSSDALAIIAIGCACGTGLIAGLVPLGTRAGVPSVVVARAAFGMRGAALLSLAMYVGNFAWIAVNNVIAASACARALGGPSRAWAIGLGLLTTAVVAAGPRAVSRADRFAVPVMVAIGVLLTWRLLALPGDAGQARGTPGGAWLRGLDVVIGYQASWMLMFADYSRYTRSPARAAWAVYLGLGVTSLWLMSLGAIGARAFGSSDPAAIVSAAGLGQAGALLLALATITTNFVNVYLSALAWKSLFPGSRDAASVWTIGGVGAALSAFSGAWLEGFADFVLALGALWVPVGGVFLSRFLLTRESVDAAALFDDRGRYAGFDAAALLACAAGAAVHALSRGSGATLPALATALVVDRALRRARQVAKPA